MSFNPQAPGSVWRRLTKYGEVILLQVPVTLRVVLDDSQDLLQANH